MLLDIFSSTRPQKALIDILPLKSSWLIKDNFWYAFAVLEIKLVFANLLISTFDKAYEKNIIESWKLGGIPGIPTVIIKSDSRLFPFIFQEVETRLTKIKTFLNPAFDKLSKSSSYFKRSFY